MYKILGLDTETTGKDPELVDVCELGMELFDVSDGDSEVNASHDLLYPFSVLVKTPSPIPFEASAIHHITNKMIEDAPSIHDIVVVEMASEFVNAADFICAHNISYDITILRRVMPLSFGAVSDSQLIDTLRLAKHILPGLPSYSLQALRYRFELDKGIKGEAHRALFDVRLSMKLLRYCQEVKFIEWDKIVAFINEPLIIDVMYFGKHRGEIITDVPTSYWAWFNRQAWKTEHPDLLYTLKKKAAQIYKKKK